MYKFYYRLMSHQCVFTNRGRCLVILPSKGLFDHFSFLMKEEKTRETRRKSDNQTLSKSRTPTESTCGFYCNNNSYICSEIIIQIVCKYYYVL